MIKDRWTVRQYQKIEQSDRQLGEKEKERLTAAKLLSEVLSILCLAVRSQH